MAKNQVAKTETKSTAVSGMGDMPEWMLEYAGAGQESIESEDMAVPRLKLGQSMTPEVKEGIAAEGDIIHTVTKEIICKKGNTFRFVPLVHWKEYILWRDRKMGGGIMARAHRVVMPGGEPRYAWDKPGAEFEDKIDGRYPVKYKLGTYIDQDGLGERGSTNPEDPDSPPAATAHHNYVILLPDNDMQMVAISLSRTAEKKAKELNYMVKQGPWPLFARVIKASSVPEERDGNKFMNWQFAAAGRVTDDDLLLQLRDFYETMKSRGVNVDFTDEDGANVSRGAAEDNEDQAF